MDSFAIGVFTGISNERYAEIGTLFKQALQPEGIEPKFVAFSKSDRKSLQAFNSGKEIDARMVYVDIGNSAQSWVVRMMFCSTLGVCLPDPSGRICKLVDQYEKESDDDKGKFAMLLEQYIWEDAAVIPVSRSGLSWLVDDSIADSGLAPKMGIHVLTVWRCYRETVVGDKA